MPIRFSDLVAHSAPLLHLRHYLKAPLTLVVGWRCWLDAVADRRAVVMSGVLRCVYVIAGLSLIATLVPTANARKSMSTAVAQLYPLFRRWIPWRLVRPIVATCRCLDWTSIRYNTIRLYTVYDSIAYDKVLYANVMSRMCFWGQGVCYRGFWISPPRKEVRLAYILYTASQKTTHLLSSITLHQ